MNARIEPADCVFGRLTGDYHAGSGSTALGTEQDPLTRNVSAQRELSKPAPQTVLKDQ